MAAAPKVDMSPMIDLVFLLLIFFMIASTMITYQKDDRVTIPVALDSQVPNSVTSRIVFNVLMDGQVADEAGTMVSLDQVEQLVAAAKAESPALKLHLRADAKARHDKVNEVIAASARAGVSEVIFSTYVID